MRIRIVKALEDLRSNFWVVPLAMGLMGAALALLTTWVDGHDRLRILTGVLETTGPAGARNLLGTVAASAITVAGVIFSVTLVSLSLAASQLGPRLLRNFLQRGGTQRVMGIFLATFVFALLSLLLIPDESFESYTPRLTIVTGLALGVASFASLLFYVHHMVHFIQAPSVLAAVSDELRTAIERRFDEREDSDDRVAWEPPDLGDEARSVDLVAEHGGYVQALDYGGLASSLAELGGSAVMTVRPGHFVASGVRVAVLSVPADADPEMDELGRNVIVGSTRSAAQDPEYVLSQLVEVAVRALSPGINDPFTACQAIDRIGEGLRRMAGRVLPSRVVADDEGVPRIRTHEQGFEEFAGAAFDGLRQHLRRDLSATLRALESIRSVADAGPAPELARALDAQARYIFEGAETVSLVDADVEALQERYEACRDALAAHCDGTGFDDTGA